MAYLDYNGLSYFKQKNDALYAKATDLSNLSDVVAQKANIDGSYESMTVGNAEQLVSSVGIEEQTPYNFRTSGGSTEIGDREELNAVVGVSVPWNQLVQNGNFASDANWHWRLSGGGAVENGEGKIVAVNDNTGNNQMFQYITLPANHKFLVSFSARKGADASFSYLRISLSSNNALNASEFATLGTTNAFFAFIMTHTSDSGNLRFGLYTTNLAVGDTAYISSVNLFDLTAMFGSTIADYIYALEQANAGAGVAWFRKYFPKLFYGYSAPTMQSVKTSAHKMVGRNAYNPTSGTAKLLGGYQYEIFGTYSSVSYTDIDGNIETLTFTDVTANNVATKRFTPTSNGTLTVTGGDSTSTCVALVWDGEKAGIYEPYETHEYALDGTKEWRGILCLDANNNLYANGDIYPPSGEAQRRYSIVDLGEIAWSGNASSNGHFTGTLSTDTFAPYKWASNTLMICGAYMFDGKGNSPLGYFGADGTFRYYYNTSGSQPREIYINDESKSSMTPADFKTAMSGIYLVYELETPTTESADPYQQTQIVDDFGTEEFVDAAVEAGERDVEILVGNETVYKPNLRAKLEMAPDSPSNGDGLYVVQQISGENTYVPLVVPNEIPDAPTADGTYVLKATVADGTATYSWVSA